MFYGYPEELIAEWCCVALSTAYAYKCGSLKPSKSAAKLFRLHRDRRILTGEWHGWLVTPNAIVDPEGNKTSPALLRNYFLMMQYAYDLVQRTGDEREIERWRELLRAA